MCKDCDLLDYQQEIANEIFICVSTGNRTECRIEIEKIMRNRIYDELINACQCVWECNCRAVDLANLINPNNDTPS